MSLHRADLSQWAGVRITGMLARPAELRLTQGAAPHMLLNLEIETAGGLPYRVRHDLGDDATQHLLAEAHMPMLRRGALVTVTCDSVSLVQHHGQPALQAGTVHSIHAHHGAGLHQPVHQPVHQPARVPA